MKKALYKIEQPVNNNKLGIKGGRSFSKDLWLISWVNGGTIFPKELLGMKQIRVG